METARLGAAQFITLSAARELVNWTTDSRDVEEFTRDFIAANEMGMRNGQEYVQVRMKMFGDAIECSGSCGNPRF